jgi:hypothetical protein
VWASGSSIAEVTQYLSISKDQFIRLRSVLKLELRLDRSQRAKPPRHRDPTPDEIAAACAELRKKHFQQRRNEDHTRVYHRGEREMPRFRLEGSRGSGENEVENLLDNFCDE